MLKVIIADDENKVRNAIVMMGEWEQLGLEYEQVSNGIALVEAINKTRPDIVITDLRMPGLGETELLQALRAIDEHMQIIIISGYDEFEYMKQAIVIRAVDYLLKPFSKGQLNEVLTKAIHDVLANKQQRLQKHWAIQHLKDELMTQLIEGRSSAAVSYTQTTGEVLHPDLFYTVAICKIANFTYMNAKFAHDEHLLFFSIDNVLNEVIGDEVALSTYSAEDKEVRLLLQMKAENIEVLQCLCNSSVEKLSTSLNMYMYIGIGELYQGLSSVHQSYQEANIALTRNTMQMNGGVVVFADLKLTASQQQITQAQTRELDVLKAAIHNGNLIYVREWIAAWHMDFTKHAALTVGQFVDINRIVGRELEQLASSDQLAENDQIQLLKRAKQLNQQLQIELDVEIIRSLLDGFIAECDQKLRDKYQVQDNVLYDIRMYIEEHLYEKISLQELADRFYMSKESISRLYKKTFGINLFDHIAELKVEKAKQMLTNDQMKIREIVSKLGFTDESHFSKMFKKYTGLTPNAYRNR